MAATLIPTATTGLGVVFSASTPVFLEGDVGRQIVFQASRAIIVGFGATDLDTISPNNNVRADIIDDFASLDPMPAGEWLLRLSPQATLDPDKKAPTGAKVTLVAGKPCFRLGDNGKYIKIYGGVVWITSINSVTSVTGELMSLMDVTVDDPPAAPAGSWTLEVASWSSRNGYPRTAEFYQGRLGQASTTEQPTTWWLSFSDDFDNYAVGAKANNAVEYTIASHEVNRIEWMADIGPLLMGTSGAEFRIQGQNQGDPLGGDVVPDVKRFTSEGSSAFQPVVIGPAILFFDRSQKKVFLISFNWETDGYDSQEVTALAEHITGEGGIRLRGVAYARRPDPRIYMVRRDGTLVVLTYFVQEKVVGFTRLQTQGTFESVAVVPRGPGFSDRVWVIVKRTINGETKRYIEYFEDDRALNDRIWAGLNADSAFVYDGGVSTLTIDVPHLRGSMVDVVADGSFRGTAVVDKFTGQITLAEEALTAEVGLHYDSQLITMRPATKDAAGGNIEGIPRSWDKCWVRVLKTVGGQINGLDIRYPPSSTPGKPTVWTGDRDVTQVGWGPGERITIEQKQPYPMTLLAIFGTLSVGDHD